ncbi:MAG: Rrf2 family transcriptional regulator [Syntrophales bacterium]|jgi:Rrf2 family protein|nr:Rrf2 family transcriptional regulator [Syntrophales bacterium]MCK9527034.1 Rrf2 family transcriptional regulator [Syntrophales bacterium]MDX9921842.1 Rrf2 family transcriptional regulator [Syntrophales bacterium]
MKLSGKSLYALEALQHLARNYGEKPLSATRLAAECDFSLKYLEQVLATLKNKGILVSTRGKHGGYSLRLPPAEVTLGDIVRAIDGPLAPIECASRTAPSFNRCKHCEPDTCWIRKVMLRVRDNMSAIMDRETLAGMLQEAEKPSIRSHTSGFPPSRE